jgi:predicted RNA polymerase sigma factor
MSNEQRIKSLLFFQKLEPNKQTLVANKAKQLESQAASEKSIRAEITTQNDRTRLLHINAHPTLSMYVTKALQLKDREELDNPSPRFQ